MSGADQPLLVSAPDKFRGSLTGAEFCGATALACERVGWSHDCCHLSDGGEGFGELLGKDYERLYFTVSGPLGEPVEAPVWLKEDRGVVRGVIESQLACGLLLAGGAERNRPLEASTRGVGELVLAAVAQGAGEVTVGCGGSASTDGGRGALEALGSFPPPGPASRYRLVAAYDVSIPFLEAARAFGPQKGASPEEVSLLSARLEELAGSYRRGGLEITSVAGGGAAGGLAGGLMAAGAELVSGFDLVAATADLPGRLEKAAAVVTGEGKLDAGSLMGKVTGGVVRAAASMGLPCLLVVGTAETPAWREAAALGAKVVSLSERFGPEASLEATARLVGEVVVEWLERLEPGAEPS